MKKQIRSTVLMIVMFGLSVGITVFVAGCGIVRDSLLSKLTPGSVLESSAVSEPLSATPTPVLTVNATEPTRTVEATTTTTASATPTEGHSATPSPSLTTTPTQVFQPNQTTAKPTAPASTHTTAPTSKPVPTAQATPVLTATMPATGWVKIGDTQEDVIRILGQPLKITQAIFYEYQYQSNNTIGTVANTATLFLYLQDGAMRVVGWWNQSNILRVTTGEKDNSAPPFTLGSTKEAVARVMGTPSVYEPHYVLSTSRSIQWWFQDDSMVIFDTKGHVVEWMNRGCLIVKLGEKQAGAAPVSLGSSLDDVTRALGTPTYLMHNLATAKPYRVGYGICDLRLDSQLRVIGWTDKGSLNISIGSKVPDAAPIAVGSSFDDVIKAMGTPDTLNPGSFDMPYWMKYGQSIVTLDEQTQKVVSWENAGNLLVGG
jgi:outer membrane protein assembly factor BamE (lipoprotein component of BamABCDE complex)